MRPEKDIRRRHVAAPPGPITIEPRAAQLRLSTSRPKRIHADPERDRTAWNIRKQRERKRKSTGKQLLTIKIKDGSLIDALVKKKRLTEREVSENPTKRRAELNKLLAEIEEAVMEKLR